MGGYMATEDPYVQKLLSGTLGPKDRAQVIERLWANEPDAFPTLVSLLAARQKELATAMEAMTAPPLSVGIVVGPSTIEGSYQVVDSRGTLTVNHSHLPDPLAIGDGVLLSAHGVIVHRADLAPIGAKVATLDTLENGINVLVDPVGGRSLAILKEGVNTNPGDLVLTTHGVVSTSLGRPRTARFNFESPTDAGFEAVGGLDLLIQQIKLDLDLHLIHQDVAQRFGLRPLHGMTLIGPPGGGKTLLARSLAAYLKPHHEDVKFLSVKPGSLRGSLYGQTENNIRELFTEARTSKFAVIFFDELDTFGSRQRNAVGTEIDTRVMASLLAEIDGLATTSEGGHVLCIGATNRLDLCDSALVREGRLGDRIYTVPRPDCEGCKAILRIYLSPNLPYSGTRDECLAAALSVIFPEKPTPLVEVGTSTRDVHGIEAGDLVSGALIAAAVEKAKHRAAARAIRRPTKAGLRPEDVILAFQDSINSEVNKLLGQPEVARATLSTPWADKITSVSPIGHNRMEA